jgi:hypothetical protein
MSLIDSSIIIGGLFGAAMGATVGLKHGILWCVLGIPGGFFAGGLGAMLLVYAAIFLLAAAMWPFTRGRKPPSRNGG